MSHAEARLTARPADRPRGTPTPGVQSLRHGALLYVPLAYRSETPPPLALMLHGAGGTARGSLDLLRDLDDEVGLVLVAPKSRASTWDVIVGGYGPDVGSIDDALAETFGRCAVDPDRIAIGGFSDGASYALSLGLANGDLFSSVLAFSPGFSAPPERVGSPRVFVSHGTADSVLPIGSTSRRIAPRLRANGYDVRYEEFAGPHTVPPTLAREAVEWALR